MYTSTMNVSMNGVKDFRDTQVRVALIGGAGTFDGIFTNRHYCRAADMNVFLLLPVHKRIHCCEAVP